jgi:cob(I)alamin adenosyltransferase
MGHIYFNSFEFLKQNMKQMENLIHVMTDKCPKLTKFVIPGGGSVCSAQTHIARTVCRRLERMYTFYVSCSELNDERNRFERIIGIPHYFNRLSDFLFALARYENLMEGFSDKIFD